MNLNPILAFAEEAEGTLQAIRGGILVCRQDGSTAELETQLRGVWPLKQTAASLGLSAIEIVLDALHVESSRIFAARKPLSDEDSRVLLDLLANAEAEVLKAGIGAEDQLMNVTDFVEKSFDFLQFDPSRDLSSKELPKETVFFEEVETAEDEFEIDAEMLEIFGMEAEDLLSNIETSLDTLFAAPGNREALWEIRRNAHTFKGAAGIVGLKKPSQLAHRVEDLLDYLAQNEIGPSEKILDLLTLSTTCLRSITRGDASPAMMARITDVYRVFDDVMAALTNPTSVLEAAKTIETDQVLAPAETTPTHEISVEGPIVKARPIVRVAITRLDELVRIVRDLVVSRSVIEQRMWEFEQQIEELNSTVKRLQTTSAKIEMDFEASMLGTQPMLSFGWGNQFGSPDADAENGDQFDSLELDRYTDFHQSARELTEATSDSFSINTALEAVKGSFEMVFDDQRRLIDEMQEKVMQIRLIRFGSLTTRLQRAVSVTSDEDHKLAAVSVENEEVELDTDVLDALVEPLMHLVRNAVVHGIESPETRRLLGKPETGKVTVRITNEETHIVLRVSDDGRGISGSMLKEKALSSGLINEAAAKLLDAEGMLNLMFLPGLTTAGRLSMSAGRGVGMSIVKESIESRKGTISVETGAQKGTAFTVRIPLAYAVAQVLLVRTDRQTMAIPLKLIKHISEFSPEEFKQAGQDQILEFESIQYPVHYLADHISVPRQLDPNAELSNTLLIETGNTRCALIVDEILKTEEIAIKPFGKPLENLQGVIGAAILGSGEIVSILDLQFLLKNGPLVANEADAVSTDHKKTRLILVVDDSPSVRHMTSKVVVGAGWDVVTAKDGVEAIEFLHSAAELPDVILSDIEMPRMDGYELVSEVRNNELFCEIPIVLITSRSGEKHREKALDLGVSDYLAKPYDDAELIATVERLSNKTEKTDSRNVIPAAAVNQDVINFEQVI